MQRDIVQGSVRSSRTLAGDRDTERPFVVHIKQMSSMPYLIVFFFHPLNKSYRLHERFWKRRKSFSFSGLWEKIMYFQFIAAGFFPINLSLPDIFFRSDSCAYYFSLFTCILKMYSQWWQSEHAAFLNLREVLRLQMSHLL